MLNWLKDQHNSLPIVWALRNCNPFEVKSIRIENNLWITTPAIIILKGMTIRQGEDVATEVFRTKDVSPYTLLGGVLTSFI